MDLIKWGQLTSNEPNIVEAAQRTAEIIMDEGNENPVKLMLEMKKMEVFIKAFKDRLKDYAINYVDDHQTSLIDGAKIQLRSIGKYDYAACNDIVWNSLRGKQILLEAEIDSRERLLKALKKPTTFTDEETGECYEVNPPIKLSNQSLTITLPK